MPCSIWRIQQGEGAVAQRREDLRVADVDRAFAADQLKAAVDEGRLSLGEYDERLRDTYAARTYGDLDRLLADLPAPHRPVEQRLVVGQKAPERGAGSEAAPSAPAAPGARGTGIPKWLVAIWGTWIFAVSVNVMIWFLVSVSSSHVAYFWPMWVAGPWGAVLLATTITGMLAGAPYQAGAPEGTGGRYARRATRRAERYARRAERYARRAERRGY